MTGAESLAIALVVAICAGLMLGYPVALTLGGISLAFALIGAALHLFPLELLGALPSRMFGIMTNETLLSIPMFIFMGVMLERSRIAEDLLESMAGLFGGLRGGLALSVIIVGVMLAASKGVVGATVVTMGLVMLPTMLRNGYDPRLASGTVAATATLAQIFPPATVLVLLGDQMSHAWQASQLKAGNFAPAPVTLIDIFAGAIVPGLVLVLAYMAFVLIIAWLWPKAAPGALLRQERVRLFALLRALALPLLLIIIVLGSILMGIASPTEAAAIGALGATLLALLRPNEAGVAGGRVQLFAAVLWPVMRRTAEITSMIFLILIGATFFSLVFRGFGGDGLVERSLSQLPGGPGGAILIVMMAMFLLGFVMDAFEIIFVIVPIVAPPLLAMGGIDPVWLAVMMAVNLQTSYMHPPLGPTLFFLRGVAPPEITTRHIYVGIIPFVVIQLAMLAVLWFWPGLVLALPRALYGG